MIYFLQLFKNLDCFSSHPSFLTSPNYPNIYIIINFYVQKKIKNDKLNNFINLKNYIKKNIFILIKLIFKINKF